MEVNQMEIENAQKDILCEKIENLIEQRPLIDNLETEEEETEEEEDDVEITLDVPKHDFKATVPVVQCAPANMLKNKVGVDSIPAIMLKPSDIEDSSLGFQFPYSLDIDKSDKPWKKVGSDISDYFNYGFNEDTWRMYCEKQRRLRVEAASSTKRPVAEGEEVPRIPDVSSAVGTAPVNFGIQIPQSILNMPPELASSIASIAASSLGLSADFVSNLPPIPGLMPTVFSNATPVSSFTLPPDLPVVVEDIQDDFEQAVKKAEPSKDMMTPDQTTGDKLSRRKPRNRSRSKSPNKRDRTRDSGRKRDRRSRSRSRDRRDRNRSSRRTRR